MGSLEIELTDALGRDLEDSVRVELFQIGGSGRYLNREEVGRHLTLTGIQRGSYRVLIAPSRYRARQFFADVKEGGSTAHKLAFPVQPSKVRGVQCSRDFGPLRGIVSLTEYGALPPIQQACLLNITAKASATTLGDGKSCLDHMVGLLRCQQDRSLVRTRPALEEGTAQSPAFRQVAGSLHAPPAGYSRRRSFKTRDAHGNLQLTFFRRGTSGQDTIVDADIDEAAGVAHLFEVVRNGVAGKTHPYNVHEILIAGQGLDPGYSFLFT